MNIKNAPTTILVILLVIASFFIGILWTKVRHLESAQANINTPKNVAAGEGPSAPVAGDVPEVTDEDWVYGNPEGKIVLIEYSDLECPFCQQFHATAKQLLEKNKDVKWIYRHFPLDTIHPSARPRAIAAECVGKIAGNDAFWKFVDTIFGDEMSIPDNQLAKIASQIGINTNDFNTCIDKGEAEADVDSDMQGGQSAGVNGTPGNFLKNTETDKVTFIPGALPLAQLEQELQKLR